MARKAKELSPLSVGRLTQPGHHAVGGVAGLYLYVVESGSRSWVLRVMVGSKRRHIGLGGFPDVPLAQAKERARKARDEISLGIDPIARKREAASQLRAQQATAITFQTAAENYVSAHGETWKSAKHRAQWTSTLKNYAYPVIGDLQIQDVGQEQVLKILEPIWKTKNETASRLRGRLEVVLDWATVRKYRTGDNPARWKGHLDKLLAAPSKIQKVEHHRALAIDAMPAFMVDLRKRDGISARALEFTILTAARSGEARGAIWAEIDKVAKVWTIPAERMKGGKEHRVPLTDAALQLIEKMPMVAGSDFIFSAPRGGQLSDMSLTQVMRRMGVDAVPHGFRSTFRDWAGERTNHPREVAEQALAHVLENKVEAAYRRGDALEKRRALMKDWESFIGKPKGAPSVFDLLGTVG
ncbi:tyrosine-type recombinase/integrase [Roseateles koreensis]|uniref:Integrase arm-type DNA-binding domain-containing protein n=1 Tax=Roseateles koreensis TaxID=2987526 RepID=A0ABT5KW44_9BURK|nr:site-specific integrase [Roseateles koreensis]MDC8787139.1 integrase arm-type DNA-binding domain-containing protein [Roseateles koreensis]